MTLLDYSTTQKEIDRLPDSNDGKQPSRRKGTIAFISIVSLATIASFVYGWITNMQIGFLLTALAMVPLAALIVISLLLSPRSEVSLTVRLLAVFWGAVGSTNLTLVIADIRQDLFGQPDLTTMVVVQAAVLEEFCKALFLFALLFWFKKLIKTPLSGAVIGILVGAGFAFLENIMYFNNAYLQGGWITLWQTVFMRAGMSFFLHAMATMCTGLFIGYVVRTRTTLNFWKKLLFVDLGLLSAMTVHGMWNGMASLYDGNAKWNLVYIFFWVPFVAIVTIALLMIRKRYYQDRKEIVIAAARRGYLQMQQAERMTEKNSRKETYKTASSPLDIVQWERSLLRIQFWNDSLSMAKSERKIRKLNHSKSKDMRRLADVVSKV